VKLTPRSVQVLELAEQGLTNDQIASELDLSPSTIKGQFGRISKQLGVHTRAAAVYKWRDRKPAIDLVYQLRRSRAINQENIVALQELIRLQTAAIEIALERVHGDSVTKT
jgi:DNA-binding CsgD family transcriptional regulator